MTARNQKRLAIVAALGGVAIFLAANVQLLTLAVQSHPECTAVATAAPARRAC